MDGALRQRAADNLAKMRADGDSDWPERLCGRLEQFELLPEDRIPVRMAKWQGNLTVTPGELRVLEAASRGLTDEMIGDLLSLSVTTVKNHLQVARYRLGAKNTTQACCEALRQGLIS